MENAAAPEVSRTEVARKPQPGRGRLQVRLSRLPHARLRRPPGYEQGEGQPTQRRRSRPGDRGAAFWAPRGEEGRGYCAVARSGV